MKLILQGETAECGLACLAMVLSHYKANYSLHELREKYAVSSKGLSLNSLVDISEKCQMTAQVFRCSAEDVTALHFPAILIWKENHFVVLKGYKHNKFTIYDPASGISRVDQDELSKHFSGIALELSPTQQFHPRKFAASLTFLEFFSGVPKMFGSFAKVLGLSILIILIALAGPLFVQSVFDEVIPEKDLGLLSVLIFGFFAVLVIGMLTEFLRNFLILTWGQQMFYELSKK